MGGPRSSLIKQCEDDFDKMCHITKTPGAAAGVQLDFDVYLVYLLLQFLILVLEMKSATSDYACMWCKIHKKERYEKKTSFNLSLLEI